MKNDIKSKDLKDFTCRYHRNGVQGAGFFACKFRWKFEKTYWDCLCIYYPKENDTGPMVNAEQCAVIVNGDITLRWRGDDFAEAVFENIQQFGDKAFSHV